MMLIQTTRFGELELSPSEVITFPNGIPGFQDLKQYALVALEDSPFFYLQSIENGDLAFIAVSPFDFFPDYEFELPGDAEQRLALSAIHDVRVLNIVTVRGDIEHATVNLVAPIVMNISNQTAIQVILENTPYTTRHSLTGNQTGSREGI